MVVTAELPSNSRAPTTTLQGWRSFITSVAPTIELPDPAELAAMIASTRERYDEQRISYHSQLVIVETSTVRQITNQGRLLMMLNQREISARRGMVVSGPWASGKTTAIKLLGKTHELLIKRKYPDQDRIPVVYITTPPKGSPRKLASEFAN
uniref:TniB family NTP-binding protein n=1 Tax=Pseudarthrobacter albicanus TaxID=2823873 RepID=UPI001BA5517D